MTAPINPALGEHIERVGVVLYERAQDTGMVAKELV
jgi:hypothetical protein